MSSASDTPCPPCQPLAHGRIALKKRISTNLTPDLAASYPFASWLIVRGPPNAPRPKKMLFSKSPVKPGRFVYRLMIVRLVSR